MVKYQHYRSSVALPKNRTLRRILLLLACCLMTTFALPAPSVADRQKEEEANELIFRLDQPFLNEGRGLVYYRAVCWRAETQSLRTQDHKILNAKARQLAASVLSIPGVTKCEFLFSEVQKGTMQPRLKVTKGLLFNWKEVREPVNLALKKQPTPTKHPALVVAISSPPDDQSTVYFSLNRELGKIDPPKGTRRQRSEMSLRLGALTDSNSRQTLERLGALGERFARMLSDEFRSEALELHFFDTYSGSIAFRNQRYRSDPVGVPDRLPLISRIIGEIYH